MTESTAEIQKKLNTNSLIHLQGEINMVKTTRNMVKTARNTGYLSDECETEVEHRKTLKWISVASVKNICALSNYVYEILKTYTAIRKRKFKQIRGKNLMFVHHKSLPKLLQIVNMEHMYTTLVTQN